MSKPARCSPPRKRACSILRQRFITTVRPAPVHDVDRLVGVQAELAPEHPRPRDRDDLLGDRRQILAATEHVDEVGRAGELGE